MITFLIPSHNYAKFLSKCISSINKNNPKFIKEIIIVNDGSTDNTDGVVNLLKKKVKLKYYKRNFRSLSRTMNFAIKMSRGNILCKIDPDDFIEKNFAKEVGQKFKELNSDFLYSNMIVNDVLSNKSFIKKQKVLSHLKLIRYPHGSGILFKKSLWKKVGGFNEKNFYQDDYDFWLKTNKLKNVKIDYCDIALYNYNKHGENMSKNFFKKNMTKVKIFLTNFIN
tara:strand:- start:1703 stop:2374 length:672 start_codon:yes stop_codon:yes gene_type:complete